MSSRLLGLVANVAEEGFTLLACQQVLAATLPVDSSTVRVGTLDAEFDVHIRVFLHAKIPFDHLKCDFNRLNMAFIAPVIWLILVMLLTFSLLEAYPAEPMPALRALDLGASTRFHGDPSSTFLVWARFGAIFEVDLIESFLHEFVLFGDLGHSVRILGQKVKAVDEAPLTRVY